MGVVWQFRVPRLDKLIAQEHAEKSGGHARTEIGGKPSKMNGWKQLQDYECMT